MKLKGKVAIVTGAGRGIGKSIATLLINEGAKIVVNDINNEWAENTVRELRKVGESIAIVADVTKKVEVESMVKTTIKTFDRIDILINNAGLTIIRPAEEISEEEWDKVINVSLKGAFLCCQAVFGKMKKEGGGRIVNIASMAAHGGVPFQTPYCAAKTGILGLTRVLAVEWAKYKINVNSVSPGATLTEQFEESMSKLPSNFRKERERRIPLGRMATPEDIAKAVLFFVSPESEYISGQNICVDGAMQALFSGYSF